MEKYITSDVVLFCFGVVGAAYVVLGLAVQIKKLFSRLPADHPITRAEYEKDQKHRAERELGMESRYAAHEKRADALIESLTSLRVEVASLTATLQRPTGECECRTPQTRLPPSSSLLPRPSRAT